jgi:transposase
MEPIIERCAGVDVGQAEVVACILVGEAHKKARKEVRTFRTLTKELLEMRDWFVSEGVPCGYGKHGRLLEAGLRHFGGRL